jgi:citrate lyase subunit beta/citryl-CoA lyase
VSNVFIIPSDFLLTVLDRAIDGVHMEITDDVGLRLVCKQGRELGFDGKSLIHPNQVSVCNEMFSPSKADVEWALQVTVAYNAAKSAGKGVCVVNGKLIEALHIDQAQDILRIYEMIRSQQL